MSKSFPFIEVSGTYKDVGNAIGTTFSNSIKQKIEHRRKSISHYENYLRQTKPYYDVTKQYFPHLIEEMEAIAFSASVSKEEYFFINNREVYDVSEDQDKRHAVNTDHCTIAVSFGRNGAVVGHNEDWSLDAMDELYVMKATIGKTTCLGLHYATAVPGVSAACNNWGLVQCINDLYQTNQVGVPKNFLARAVLECTSLDEAEHIIRKTPKASGFNHVLVQNQEVRNVEIAGSKIAVNRVVGDPYVHTNHYLSSEMKELEKFHTKSSEARYKRTNELVENGMTKGDMALLLSDTQNQEFPICRSNETIGSLVLLPQKQEVWMCYGHPCAGEYTKYLL
ncbi:MAG TPA: hypothetical protein DCX25_01310 [Candidatus Pacebacteria bacterium]|nr:MAG: Cysteine peptidase/transferase, family C45 [Microgenomates group bacterium GW2011_GWB1_45_17]KKU23610.1 MAG: Cysteine peptidase/transferase, family C45 [Microgenomates group bacterium GW2011_GWC1_46_15]KKU24329.1 MAG: Cysteine peptidase/transferase, family C45 [Microgenomates group bacterium GW2011_GWA1_46_15]HAV14946.1 hypothetical protein [Candidatus Paceibacterota bacterium]HCR11303.1 hypothetical protein [Candidatus Paceibacterota bacterium]